MTTQDTIHELHAAEDRIYKLAAKAWVTPLHDVVREIEALAKDIRALKWALQDAVNAERASERVAVTMYEAAKPERIIRSLAMVETVNGTVNGVDR